MTNLSPDLEQLAGEIGENIYIDVAKWHLYLADAHLHIPLAQKLYPLLEDDDLTSGKVTEILQSILVALGGGKQEVPLLTLIPTQGQQQLMTLLEDYQANHF